MFTWFTDRLRLGNIFKRFTFRFFDAESCLNRIIRNFHFHFHGL
uniref:Uncharacterized protein n=1 Tax=Arabidopsis thaliana TaxID=3702 RepID=Q0WLL9_ARATH|nr:hypothetical protein [Arabidopsis thaliana]